jgi:hypothetical protein
MTNSTPQGPESIHPGPLDDVDADDDLDPDDGDEQVIDISDNSGPELTADVDDIDAGSARDR